MIAPALPALDAEFHITNAVESQIMLSVFVLAYAIGPLFLGPLSEVYGRSLVIQSTNVFYLVFNTACGAAKNKVQMTVFRFLAGLGGSAPLSVSWGTLISIDFSAIS
jgi:MFS family permease